jgi:hypothetical protein
VADHPALAGVEAEHLRDWRGEATLLPPRLQHETRTRQGSAVLWCDLPVTRLWRCGNRGNVASVLIEKPACGDFLPILDGGYSLQYSPLLEFREGRGLVVFCQLDVTGRTEPEPIADRITRNLLEHVAAWQPEPRRRAVYAGEPAGLAYLKATGVAVEPYGGGPLAADTVLVLGPQAAPELTVRGSAVADFVRSGGHVVAISLDGADFDALLPFQVGVVRKEHIATFFAMPGARSPFAGIGPADVHNRDPRTLPLIASGATVVGNGVLASTETVVFCQLAPWHFDPAKQSNLKRTFRRVAFATTRLMANQGVACATPLIERFHRPLSSAAPEKRWLQGFYLDEPEEWDDPYRFFRW